MDQYAAEADLFWDYKSKTTTLFGHFVDDIQGETAAEQAIWDANNNMDAAVAHHKWAKQALWFSLETGVDVILQMAGVPPTLLLGKTIIKMIIVDNVEPAH